MASRKRDEEEPDAAVTNKRLRSETGSLATSVAVETKVVYVKGCPAATTEADLVTLSSPFGAVTSLLLIAHKNLAFIQMPDVETAAKMVNYYRQHAGVIRGQAISVAFSNRTEVSGGKQADGTGAAAAAAAAAGGGAAEAKASGKREALESTVLLVDILNARLVVSPDHLYQVFATYGPVLRIVGFQAQKGAGQFKALVEMSKTPDAVNAKRMLDGKDMFQDPYNPAAGCCTLKLSFSTTPAPLSIKRADPLHRDYTAGGTHTAAQSASVPPPTLPSAPAPGASAPHPPQPQPQAWYPAAAAAAAAAAGGVAPGLMPMAPAGAAGAVGYPVSAAAPKVPGCVLAIKSLDTRVKPDELFTLFGVYGDVIRVKIAHNHPGMAFVQMSKPHEAALAISYLNECPVFSPQSRMLVTLSKMSELTLSKQSEGDNPQTKDYTGSKQHRFRLPDSKNAQHVCAPSPTLHVSNISDGVSDAEVKVAFEKAISAETKDPVQVEVKFFATPPVAASGPAAAGKPKPKRRMATVTTPSLTHAVVALIRCHNLKLKELYLRVTFAHSKAAASAHAANIASHAAAGGAGVGVGLMAMPVPAAAAGAGAGAAGAGMGALSGMMISGLNGSAMPPAGMAMGMPMGMPIAGVQMLGAGAGAGGGHPLMAQAVPQPMAQPVPQAMVLPGVPGAGVLRG